MFLELLARAFERFVWNPVVAPFRNEIVVDARPGVFSFFTNGAAFQLPTYVCVSSEPPHRVLAVGQDYNGREAAIRVDLFEPGPWNPALPDRGKLLDAFFRAAFVRTRGRTLVRPRVKFRGLSSFDALLHGFQAMLFMGSVMRCGAHAVYAESGGAFVEITSPTAGAFST